MTKEEQFNAFWAAYPNKKGKLDAQKAFERAIRKTTLETMLKGIKAYELHKPEWQSFKYPASWLRAGSWDDEWQTTSPLAAFGRIQSREEYIAAEMRRSQRSFQH